MAELKLYQPSNGTESEQFMDHFCMNCKNCDPDPNGEKQCDIMMRSMLYGTGHKHYPNEWRYVDGKPTCTAHEYWNWEKQGDPDKAKGIESHGVSPNQLNLF